MSAGHGQRITSLLFSCTLRNPDSDASLTTSVRNRPTTSVRNRRNRNRNRNRELRLHYREFFGSLAKAQSAAGLSGVAKRRPWTRERVIGAALGHGCSKLRHRKALDEPVGGSLVPSPRRGSPRKPRERKSPPPEPPHAKRVLAQLIALDDPAMPTVTEQISSCVVVADDVVAWEDGLTPGEPQSCSCQHDAGAATPVSSLQKTWFGKRGSLADTDEAHHPTGSYDALPPRPGAPAGPIFATGNDKSVCPAPTS